MINAQHASCVVYYSISGIPKEAKQNNCRNVFTLTYSKVVHHLRNLGIQLVPLNPWILLSPGDSSLDTQDPVLNFIILEARTLERRSDGPNTVVVESSYEILTSEYDELEGLLVTPNVAYIYKRVIDHQTFQGWNLICEILKNLGAGIIIIFNLGIQFSSRLVPGFFQKRT